MLLSYAAILLILGAAELNSHYGATLSSDKDHIVGSIQVNYTLWYPSNDSLTVLNILVSVPEKSSFYIVAKEAEKIDPRFTIDDYVYFNPEGYFITSINGLSEDPGNDLFWYIYDMDKAPDTSNPPTNAYLSKNEVESIIVSNGRNYLFWYKTFDDNEL